MEQRFEKEQKNEKEWMRWKRVRGRERERERAKV